MGSRDSRRFCAITLPVPNGSTPSVASDPASPCITWKTVPSPPHTRNVSNPAATASAACCPAECADSVSCRCTSLPYPLSSSAICSTAARRFSL